MADLFLSIDLDREPGDRLAPEVVDEICLISGSDECGGGGGNSDIYERFANKGQINGYAALDGSARLPAAQLPLPALEYKGTWNAATNTPTLSNGSGNLGDIWRVTTAGNDLGFQVEVGDVIFYDGNAWYKLGSGSGSGSGGTYELPVATSSTLGGVKQGAGVTIAADGTLTLNAATLAGYQLKSERGVANGYASLDAAGKMPSSQLPVSALEYKGTWNAATNTPPLQAGVGTQGDMWRVTVTGTQFGVKFTAGDFALFNGTTWETATSGTAGVSTVAGLTGDVAAGPLKTALAVDKVDNTADAAKAVLSATKLTTARKLNGVPFDGTADITVPISGSDPALASYQLKAEKGAPDGYAPLDAGSKVPAANLPSYVDDVLEFPTQADLPQPGTAGVIYVDLATGNTFRWSGTTYIRISDTVSSTGIEDSTEVGRAVLTAADETAARDAIGAVSDFDPRLDDNRMPIDGSVTTQKLEASIATTISTLQSPYFGTSTTGVLNADNGTEVGAKRTGFGVPSFTITDKPFFGMTLAAEAATNTLRLGGGSTRGRAATQIEFYTAANNTTDAGTRWARITGTGDTYFTGVLLQVGENAGPQATIAVNSSATASSDFTWGTAGYGRWTLRADATPETGGDVGSDLVLLPRTDLGVPKLEVMRVTRSTGGVRFASEVSFGGTVVASDVRPQPAPLTPGVSSFRLLNQLGASQFEFECNDLATVSAAKFYSVASGTRLDLAQYAAAGVSKTFTVYPAGGGGLSIWAQAGMNSTLYAQGGTTLLYVSAAAGMQLNAVPVVTTTGVASLSNKTIITPTITGASGTTACLFNSAATSVNYVQITGMAAGQAVTVSAQSSLATEANVSFGVMPKGTGVVFTRVDAAISSTGVEQIARLGVRVDPPTSTNSVGRPGQFATGSDGLPTPTYYLYMCVDINKWVRTTMTSF